MGDEKKCPECAELIKKDAKVCKHCGHRFTPADLAAQRKQDEEEGRTILTGCFGLIVIGGIFYAISQMGGCSETSSSTPAEDVLNAAIAAENATAVEPAKDKQTSRPARQHTTASPLPSKAESAEAIAAVINLNDHLCARVTNVAPLQVSGSVYEVTCIEYRGGTGTVKYIVNADTGVAFKQ